MQKQAEAQKGGETELDLLAKMTRERLESLIASGNIYAEPSEYRARLEHELKVFGGSGYASIILIIADYISWARENSVVVGPGRGSAAGSLVVYLSRITTIDPIRFGLIFERFLNPERVSLPDIDTDFSDRDAVIGYLYEKYGRNRVAKVCVPSFYKPRSAIDEFAKALHVEYKESKRITKLIGDAKTFEEAIKSEPALAEIEEQNPDLFRLARQAQGFVRQVTTHPSAVIVTRGPIGSEIPMQKPPGLSNEGVLATGWDGEELDSLGYVKLDILTVDNLSVINKAIALIKSRYGVEIDFYNLDITDRKTLDGFEAGETVAVFQFEEQKSVSILKQLNNITFEEVCAVNALIRPGIDVPRFIKARNSGEVSYLIPALEPILRETYGVIIYQEQVMRICVDVCGFTMAEADKFRKIIAKTSNQSKDFSSEDRGKFYAGYVSKGHPEEKFDELWSMILACQSYLFNKSHGYAYGYIAYADMYLKRHYPIEFMCAALQTKSRELFVKECGRLGIKVIPPSVNSSGETYEIEGDSIRVGLGCLKHIGSKAKIIIQRRPFNDEFDFLERAKPNQKQIESLCYSGALDCFSDRQEITRRFCKQSFNEQVTLADLANGELEAIGFYLLFDPLGPHEDRLQNCITPLSARRPRDALVGGLVSRVHEHQCKNGKMMAFVNLITTDGDMDVIVWPDDWHSEKKKVKIGAVIIANGRKLDNGGYSIKQSEVLGGE